MITDLNRVTTIKELIEYITRFGIPTDQENICKMQDIVGHSTIGELLFVANDIGRNDENGNPDPSGTWTSNRRGTRDSFYSMLFTIWNWEDACRFWNNNSNPEHQEVTELKRELRSIKDRYDYISERNMSYKDQIEKMQKDYEHVLDANAKAAEEIEKKDLEIVRLKARLFDLMEKSLENK